MSRRFPPFSALRAFEAAARLHSFKAAAEELCVTQSAVSHQIKALEQFLSSGLFLRNANGVALTQCGVEYYSELTVILDRLDRSTKRIGETDCCGLLSIRATPHFTSRWLIPRMKRFNSAFPDIELDVTTTDRPTKFPSSGVDILIQYGTDAGHGLRVDPFLSSARYPVCSREFCRNNPNILKPGDLARTILLRDTFGDDWEAWFQSAGIETVERRVGPRFAHCELAIRAAEEGQGVALGYGAMIDNEIKLGTLVRLFDFETTPKIVYSLACPESSSNLPRVAAFRNWVISESKGTPRN